MTAWQKLSVHLAQHYDRGTASAVLEMARAVAREERDACADVAKGLNGWGTTPCPELAEHISAQIRAREI